MQPGWAGAAVRIQDFHEPRELDVRGFEQRHFHPVVVAHDVDRSCSIQRYQAEDSVNADFRSSAGEIDRYDLAAIERRVLGIECSQGCAISAFDFNRVPKEGLPDGGRCNERDHRG